MNYYRKNVDNTANDLKLKMQMAAFTLKLSENNDKIDDLIKADKDIKKDISDNSNSIKNFYTKQDVNNIISQYYLKKYLYDKTYIDTNFLVKSEIDKKDNIILSKVNDNFYSRTYMNDNYYLKGYINNNYYNKSELNNNFNNLYNRQYLDLKFDNIYDKTQINDKINKLDRNLVLFNTNLTKFIDEDYKEDKKILEDNILDNKNKFNNFIINTFGDFSNNISNLNDTQNDRLEVLENYKLNESQLNKVTQLQNIDLNKINASYNYSVFNKQKVDKLRYYTKEFILHNIDLNKTFELTPDMEEILVNDMDLHSRTFDINDVLKLYLNIIIKYENNKSMFHTIYMRLDVLYDDETLIKSYNRYPTSKGFIFLHTICFNISRIVKIFKKTEKILFRIYFCRTKTNTNILVKFVLTNIYEKNYLDIEWLSII